MGQTSTARYLTGGRVAGLAVRADRQGWDRRELGTYLTGGGVAGLAVRADRQGWTEESWVPT